MYLESLGGSSCPWSPFRVGEGPLISYITQIFLAQKEKLECLWLRVDWHNS